jgi:hypothetical protein
MIKFKKKHKCPVTEKQVNTSSYTQRAIKDANAEEIPSMWVKVPNMLSRKKKKNPSRVKTVL